MSLADTAKLLASLDLDDSKFQAGVRRTNAGLGRMEGRFSKIGGIAQKGVHNAVTNITRLGMVAGVAVAGFVKVGIDNLTQLENASASVSGAIGQVGLTGKITAAQVAAWSVQIEDSIGSAFDDKDILAASATLIRFGHVTAANLKPAMLVMTDLAAKTGSVGSAATLLSKALADPTKAAGKLARAGVVLTKAQQDQIKAFIKHNQLAKAQKVILDSLAQTTKGAAAASMGPLAHAQAMLGDAFEEATKALAIGFLPVLERLAAMLRTKLADPAVINQIKSFGQGLADAFSAVLDYASKVPWSTIGSALRTAGDAAKTILDAFLAMPDWVQAAVISGWGLNKLTGGAVGSIVGELGKGLIRGVLGMNAGIVNINAGVVRGGAGVGGAVGVAGKSGGLASKIGTALSVATAAVAIAEAVQTYFAVNQATSDQATGIKQTLGAEIAGGASLADLNRSLSAIDTGIAQIRGNPLFVLVQGDALTKLDAMRADTVAAIGRQTGMIRNADRWWEETSAGTTRTSDQVEAMRRALTSKQDAANAKLGIIAEKKYQNHITTNVSLAVTTRVSVRDIKQSIYTQQTYRTSSGTYQS